ncbi:hypothetical protein JMJ77_0006463, partial [Colletotrichum scovillei]
DLDDHCVTTTNLTKRSGRCIRALPARPVFLRPEVDRNMMGGAAPSNIFGGWKWKYPFAPIIDLTKRSVKAPP